MKGKERILMTEWPEMLNFVFEKSEYEMKNYVIESLVSGVLYCIGILVIDAISGQFKSFGFYLLSSIIFGLLYSLVMGLFHKITSKK